MLPKFYDLLILGSMDWTVRIWDHAQSSSSSTSTHFRVHWPSVTSIHPFKSGTVASSPSSHLLSVCLNSPLSQNLPAQTSPGGFLSSYRDNIKKFPLIGVALQKPMLHQVDPHQFQWLGDLSAT